MAMLAALSDSDQERFSHFIDTARHNVTDENNVFIRRYFSTKRRSPFQPSSKREDELRNVYLGFRQLSRQRTLFRWQWPGYRRLR
jgi:hypothetical protein